MPGRSAPSALGTTRADGEDDGADRVHRRRRRCRRRARECPLWERVDAQPHFFIRRRTRPTSRWSTPNSSSSVSVRPSTSTVAPASARDPTRSSGRGVSTTPETGARTVAERRLLVPHRGFASQHVGAQTLESFLSRVAATRRARRRSARPQPTAAAAASQSARSSASRSWTIGAPRSTAVPSRTSTRSMMPSVSGRISARAGRPKQRGRSIDAQRPANEREQRSTATSAATAIASRRCRGSARNASFRACSAPNASASGTWWYSCALRSATVA